MSFIPTAYVLLVLIALGLTLVHALSAPPGRVPLWIALLFIIVAMLVAHP